MEKSLKIGAAYIRVSTDDQLDYSPESQIKAIRDYAKRNNIIIPDEYIFQDDGISGRKADKRPGFQSMIAQAKKKPAPFQIILVWKFSRFARNREDSIVYKSMLKKQCKIDVVSISEPLSDDKTSILIEALLEAMDEYYSINLAEEVKRGMTEKAGRGEPLSVPPYGYDLIEKNLVIKEDEAKIVKYIFSKLAAGTPSRILAMECTAMGAKTHRGNPFESRTVDYIAQNPVYIGKIRWNPQRRTRRNFDDPDLIIVDGHHEPIIDENLWKCVQDVFQKRKALSHKSEKPFKFSNMLQGIVRCSACGGTLIKAGIYLQCQKYTKGLCKVSHSLPYSKAANLILEQLEHDFKVGEFQNIRKIETEKVESDLLDAQIKREEKKLERAKEAYLSGIDSPEEYREAKTTILNTINNLKAKLPSKKETAKELSKKLVKNNKQIIQKLKSDSVTLEEKNKILRSVLEKVVFDKETKELIFYYFYM